MDDKESHYSRTMQKITDVETKVIGLESEMKRFMIEIRKFVEKDKKQN